MKAPPPSPGDNVRSSRVFTVGTLTYDRTRLFMLFGWLLLGDVVFVLMNDMEPKLLPLILKSQHATDKEIAFIVGTIVAMMNLVVTPIVSYRSDRKRSRWGRRIPYLLWATPFVSVFLAATAFVPELTKWLMQWQFVQSVIALLPVSSPVVAIYGLLILVYEAFHMVVASIFFYLFRDVVPTRLLGRFLALFRVFGALGSFIVNYWILGISLTHTRQIFLGVAVLYAVGFVGMCLFVKEPEYPPAAAVEIGRQTQRGPSLLLAVGTFVRESFCAPIYLWVYLAAAMIGSLAVLQSFAIFFPQLELGLPLHLIGRLNAWASLAWILFAFPVGWALDRFGPIRVLTVCLVVQGFVALVSFALVSGQQSYFIATVGSSAFFPFGLTVLSLTLLLQRMFATARFGQLSAAAAIVRTLLVAIVISPFVGWLLSSLQGIQAKITVPGYGEVIIGPYRFVYVLQLILLVIALFATRMVHREWLKLGGPENYNPPL